MPIALCQRCQRIPPIPTERYCARCRALVLEHLENVGYLQPLGDDEGANHGIYFYDERDPETGMWFQRPREGTDND